MSSSVAQCRTYLPQLQYLVEGGRKTEGGGNKSGRDRLLLQHDDSIV